MKITLLKTNHIKNPLGFSLDKPVFSWTVEDTQDKKQISAQVIVSKDEGFTQILFDSGKVDGSEINSRCLSPIHHLDTKDAIFLESQGLGRN